VTYSISEPSTIGLLATAILGIAGLTLLWRGEA